MRIFRDIEGLKVWSLDQQNASRRIGFVPTMGALHEGHLRLLEHAQSACDVTVCSIFVNPVQFNNTEDLKNYPRTLDKDLELLEAKKCDAVFIPDASEMYPETPQVKFDFGNLDKILEGAYRPGHFNGVALVVSKLFNMVMPHEAYFGQKDYQQYMIVSRLVKDLSFDVKLKCVPTTREQSGLAMSSRNARLSPEERVRATILYRSLRHAQAKLLEGKRVSEVKTVVEEMCAQAGCRLEYLSLADRKNFAILEQVTESADCILLVAAYVGEVRLIDNMMMTE
ncbi:MAG: pantoate--beta-alanine ligase [Bacteroidetes bacterium]|nr:pantoate--beta-alanine ligase [Bacteroidota bacterium]MBS1977335.1 pantoate--beta-alanine ligase [Bacteroidota bacterium]